MDFIKATWFFFFFSWWSQKMSSLAHQTSLRSCLKPLLTNDRKQIGVCSSPKVCVYHNRHAKDSYFSLEWDSSDLSSTDPVERNSHFSVKVIHPKVGIQVMPVCTSVALYVLDAVTFTAKQRNRHCATAYLFRQIPSETLVHDLGHMPRFPTSAFSSASLQSQKLNSALKSDIHSHGNFT